MSLGGDAFDLNGDGRPDNALGIAGLFVNPQIAQSLGSQLLLIIGLEADDPENELPVRLNVFADMDADNNPNNNLMPGAELDVDPASLDDDGAPRATTNAASITRGVVTAEPNEIELAIPVEGDEFLMTLRKVQLEAEIDGDFDALEAGRLGGAVDEDELQAAMEVLPIDPGMRGMIEGFLASPDIDADGDGRNESFSVAMEFTAVHCTFAGEEM